MLLVHITETGENSAMRIVTGIDSTAAVADTSDSSAAACANSVLRSNARRVEGHDIDPSRTGTAC
jgi:hypothetical protein